MALFLDLFIFIPRLVCPFTINWLFKFLSFKRPKFSQSFMYLKLLYNIYKSSHRPHHSPSCTSHPSCTVIPCILQILVSYPSYYPTHPIVWAMLPPFVPTFPLAHMRQCSPSRFCRNANGLLFPWALTLPSLLTFTSRRTSEGSPTPGTRGHVRGRAAPTRVCRDGNRRNEGREWGQTFIII